MSFMSDWRFAADMTGAQALVGDAWEGDASKISHGATLPVPKWMTCGG
jgi:hypothetical protein